MGIQNLVQRRLAGTNLHGHLLLWDLIDLPWKQGPGVANLNGGCLRESPVLPKLREGRRVPNDLATHCYEV